MYKLSEYNKDLEHYNVLEEEKNKLKEKIRRDLIKKIKRIEIIMAIPFYIFIFLFCMGMIFTILSSNNIHIYETSDKLLY